VISIDFWPGLYQDGWPAGQSGPQASTSFIVLALIKALIDDELS